ncbi:MAG TPA: DUF1446 domain-containing protein, partial [Lacipirellulaceae bacterium]|nr:DUF1446 domain-containing protein [Lacipirellulaceae bacterium]
GRDAAAKARRCGEAVLERVREAGFELRESIVECLGNGDAAAGIIRPEIDRLEQFGETVLRVAVESDSRDAAERFVRELMPLITAGPQGTTGYAEGRPRVHPVFRYWPCLVDREAVVPKVELIVSTDSAKTVAKLSAFGRGRSELPSADRPSPQPSSEGREGYLYDIACARSGDKGTSANVGVIARSEKWWPLLLDWLSAERVSSFLATLGIESVERFELPNLQALNFVLRGALRQSLRTDAQGKAIGQILLEMRLPADAVRTILNG